MELSSRIARWKNMLSIINDLPPQKQDMFPEIEGFIEFYDGVDDRSAKSSIII